MILLCGNPNCKLQFDSKHSKAKYCSRQCAGKVNQTSAISDPKYTDQDLIDKLLEEAMRLGKTPSKRDMVKPNASTYRKRFGSYNNAVILAGLEPNIKIFKEPSGKPTRSISLGLRFKVLQRDNFTCVYCGGTPDKGYTLNADHVIPFSKGGETTLENLATACWECNQGKSDGCFA